MIVTPELVEQILGVCRDCEEAIVRAYGNRRGNPNQITFGEFGKILAIRFPAVPFFNRARGLTEDELGRLPEVMAFYRETKTRFMLWLSPETVTEKMASALVGYGFVPWDYHTKFYADINDLLQEPVISDVIAEEVGSSQLDEYFDIMLEGRQMPVEYREAAKANMLLRFEIPGMRLFLGRLKGRAVGGAVFYQKGKVGYLADAATPVANRGLGCQLKLMEARIRYARAQGCRVIVGATDFGNPSFRNMQRTGLRIAFTEMAWHSPSSI